MISSAIIMGIIGFFLTFMPNETLTFLNQDPTDILIFILQLMGALYFGFAILNWMAKNVLIGGIYAKPLCLGNFVNFLMGALTLIKLAINGSLSAIYFWILTILYILFAIAFGFVSLTNPNLKENPTK
jgi:hypothetical protein